MVINSTRGVQLRVGRQFPTIASGFGSRDVQARSAFCEECQIRLLRRAGALLSNEARPGSVRLQDPNPAILLGAVAVDSDEDLAWQVR
jgi:hypothetical protein